jgi:hypothetical protein
LNAKTSSSTRRLLLVLLVILVGLTALAYNRQSLADWWALRTYRAPDEVAQLATQDTMTPYGRKVLYVNRPALQLKSSFRGCNLGKEQAAVLGCYHSNQQGIFVLKVTDNRLNGIEQVTAAHEMLHAAYDRLSSKQKQSVSTLLENYYHRGLQDPVIKEQMANYQKIEPNDVVDEMHSVFGTEVAHLPAALEAYYQRYFTNRTAVTGYYNAYEAEFTSRQAAVKTDDAQLTQLKQLIDAQEATLQSQYTQLQATRSKLDTFRQQNNISDYNAGVPGYNAAVKTYNDQVGDYKTLVAQYNQLVDTRNSIALEAQELTNEITSNVSLVQ